MNVKAIEKSLSQILRSNIVAQEFQLFSVKGMSLEKLLSTETEYDSSSAMQEPIKERKISHLPADSGVLHPANSSVKVKEDIAHERKSN